MGLDKVTNICYNGAMNKILISLMLGWAGFTLPVLHVQSFEERTKNEINSVDTKGIPTDYLLAIAELESGNGRGAIFRQTKNLFSITEEKTTHNPFFFAKNQYHKVYGTDTQSIQDIIRLLTLRRRYRLAYKEAILDNHNQFFMELQKSGYAGSDKHYAEKLERIFEEIKNHELAKRIQVSQDLSNGTNNNLISQGISK